MEPRPALRSYVIREAFRHPVRESPEKHAMSLSRSPNCSHAVAVASLPRPRSSGVAGVMADGETEGALPPTWSRMAVLHSTAHTWDTCKRADSDYFRRASYSRDRPRPAADREGPGPVLRCRELHVYRQRFAADHEHPAGWIIRKDSARSPRHSRPITVLITVWQSSLEAANRMLGSDAAHSGNW
jgi:hypothetical protein